MTRVLQEVAAGHRWFITKEIRDEIALVLNWIEDKQDAIEAFRQEVGRLNNRLSCDFGERGQLREELAEAKQYANDLEVANGELANEIDRLRDEKRKWTKDFDEISARFSRIVKSYDLLLAKHNRLLNSIEDAREEATV